MIVEKNLGQSMKLRALPTLAFLICSLIGSVPQGMAQTTNAAPAKRTGSDRYLVVVESSKAMQNRAANTARVTGDLIRSGLDGQMHDGDTIGLWTYSETLRAGNFPMAVWTSADSAKIAADAQAFLAHEKYGKIAVFAPVISAVNGIAKNSPHLTLIILSTGENDISGTPFDARIKDSYSTWRIEQQKARMPFVTIFRARRGQFAGVAVTPAPWTIEVPVWPAEPQIVKAKTNAPTVAASSAAPPNSLIATNPTGPSSASALIFTGKKQNFAPTASTEQNTAAPDTLAAAPANISPVEGTWTSPQALAQTSTVRSAAVQRSAAPAPADLSSTPPAKAAPAEGRAIAAPSVAVRDAATQPSPAQKSADKALPVPVAVTAPVLNPTIAWIGGFAVLVIGSILIFFRYGPSRSHPSLITRSLENEAK